MAVEKTDLTVKNGMFCGNLAVKGLKLMSRSFMLVLKLSSVENCVQKWYEHVQFSINSEFQNAIEKVEALFFKSRNFENR